MSMQRSLRQNVKMRMKASGITFGVKDTFNVRKFVHLLTASTLDALKAPRNMSARRLQAAMMSTNGTSMMSMSTRVLIEECLQCANGANAAPLIRPPEGPQLLRQSLLSAGQCGRRALETPRLVS